MMKKETCPNTNSVFQLVFNSKVNSCDIINDGCIIVISSTKRNDDKYLVKVDDLNCFNHNLFLSRYSQYLHFRM